MLAFLHTAAVHVPTFTRLMQSVDPSIPTRHEVREDLFAQALADGRVTEATQRSAQEVVSRLIGDGARVVLCTCSTLGSAVEATPGVVDAVVLRVDRPMAVRACQLGRPILLVAAIGTAMTTGLMLVREAAQQHGFSLAVRELMCDDAWKRFQAGDQAGYATAIAEAVQAHAQPNDVVMLAQASMAPAAALIGRSDIEVLTSPEVAIRAAVAAYHAASAIAVR